MRFQVPQFIDIEDKIFGPFTWKQFLYLAGGAGISYVLYQILPLFFAVILIIPVAGLALALTFIKVNNKPFVSVLESGIKYFFQSKLYIWKKVKKEIVHKEVEAVKEEVALPKLSGSRLKDIAWNLDIVDMSKRQ